MTVPARCTWGCAPPEAEEALEALHRTQEPALALRKGRLVFATAGQEAVERARAVSRAFFRAPSHDTAPVLAAAMRAAQAASQDATMDLPVIAALRDLELVVVGSESGAALVVNAGGVRDMLGARGQALLLPERRPMYEKELAPLRAMTWRLGSGDAVVLGDREALARVSADDLRRIIARHRAPSAAAAAIFRAARTRRGANPAVAVIYGASLGAVPEMPARPGERPSTTPRRPSTPSGGTSPIWIALAVAMVAIGMSLWATRPDVSGETIGSWLRLLLIPTVTATPGAPPTPRTTPTASFSQPAPRPASPRQGDTLLNPQITLRWTWNGQLADDEAFDVRLWHTGMPEASIGVTRATEMVATMSGTGWYEWTVVVVQVAQSRPVSPRSPRPPGVLFYWRKDE